MSRFFIERPIFATVVSIVIVTLGLTALGGLPIAQYPDLAPPTISVTASYPGADSQVIADTVAAPIEQEVNGVEGMLYMSSTSASDGSYNLSVTFAPGTNLDIASVQVQNRVAAAEPKLPEEVRRFGIKTQKRMPDFALMISVSSPTGELDDIYLSNFATLQLRDPLKRINGVGDAQVFGAAEYAMRLWLDPAKLEARNVTTAEVLAAIREQNVQVAAGKVGEQPAPAGTPFEYSISVKGRLVGADEFADIVVRDGDDGRLLRVRDLARVELGASNYAMGARLDGQPAAIIALYQLPGANMIEISDRVQALIEELRPSFPAGLDAKVSYDASNVVRASIEEIITTLLVASILVILTVLLFLQDLRATIIPSVTIPVSLIGTFAVMAGLGFSLNTLSLFGIVLAIGIVVDDAIVVVENIARNIDEEGLAPREAAIKAMQEVTGPVVATTLVLLAVFVPTSFLPGLVGEMYRQFGLTISAATVFSSINALSLSPALCALLLRPSKGRKKNFVFRALDTAIEWSTRRYTTVAGIAVRKLALSVLVFLGVSFAGAATFASLPTSFVPQEDMGFYIVAVQLPDASSLERTAEVVDKIDEAIAATPGIAANIAILGYSMLDSAANSATASHLLVAEPWGDRTDPATSMRAILGSLTRRFAAIPDARIFAFPIPSIPGVGIAGGFDMQLQDRGGVGLSQLQNAADRLAASANGQAALERVSSGLRANVPQLFLDIDRDKVKQMGLALDAVFGTVQTYLGSAYANDFNQFSRTFQVRLQAEGSARAKPEDILRLRMRSPDGGVVPLGAVASVEERYGPTTLNRYNLYPAASIKGQAAAGFSSGQALDLMERMVSTELPTSFGSEWTGLSFQEKQAGGAIALFLLALFLVYLVLAAQYESWALPIAIILAVPLGLLGAALGTLATPFGNGVYTQIGIVLLIALVAKNAILIVEFAREKRQAGLGVADAALEAARLRFRPILMTAISFVLGTAPLVLASGAGAAARVALGVAVFYGMIGATIMGVVLTPALYRLVQGTVERLRPQPSATTAAAEE